MVDASLEPPDLVRCQAETVQRTPLALGGTHRRTRCRNVPTVVLIERVPGVDGKIGAMSLCPDCHKICVDQLGGANFLVARIKKPAVSAQD